ncbi:arabinose efflux permease family protein [Desulfosporosinus acidiphilus SJ4]|uniref:Arabinose efflux permease family protein n=1 Tax=Desulfosporosinus acidiphilus (strain DSM 22704 / JCM 16185 / SJ4) TaxID=646529 RepID=I4D260_DESAJ|nr:multidrug efflux MFS transporter [Desulfosporosinus acidiphilus]AFM39884.1 arabinose efflux permease family protein [Desulfosporosinus acidiphilus SJ4]
MPIWKRNLIICWFGSFATMAGMNLVIPFLPIYIQQLGVHNIARVEQWSGVAFGATALSAAIVSPLWGKLADIHGRKLMLLRASLGMAIIMILIGFVHNVYELVGLRLLMGAISGYVPAAITLVSSQTPREHAGWALGTLTSGSVGGSLIGPLVGGTLSEIIGLRHVFYITGGFLLLAFLIAWVFVREDFIPNNSARLSGREVWKIIDKPKILIAMFITSFMLQLASMSIEPIVTIYVKLLMNNASHIAIISGAVVSAVGLANVLIAPFLGKLSDRIGPYSVLFVCLLAAAIILIPQAYVRNAWQLIILRFMMGIATAGFLPAINSLLKSNIPETISGRIFGYNNAAQNLGNVAGPVIGGQMAAYWGFHYVFFSTSILLFINALWVYYTSKGSFQISGSRCA